MYAVCSSIQPLSQCFYSRKSYLSALLDFFALFPNVDTVLVFRDLRAKGNAADFQFISMLNANQIQSLKSKYSS